MEKTKMLKKNYEFKNVFSKGKYYTGKCIEVFVLENRKQDKNLLGIAISVKIGKATKRNHKPFQLIIGSSNNAVI